MGDPAEVLEVSNGEGDSERVSLVDLPAGTYYLLVEGTTALVSNPSYSLAFDSAPDAAAHGDLAEDNDAAETAHDLRTVEGVKILSDLSIHQAGNEDWFAFTLAAPTKSG